MRVVAAAVVRSGRVMVLRRGPGQRMAGGWEFPGGKVEKGESDAAALEREMLEELGMRGAAGALVAENAHKYPFGSIWLRLYLFDWQAGDAALSVHDRMDWVRPDALDAVDFLPADRPLANALKRMLLG
jgi:8-oxo-dGTP diphosphatase